MGQRWGQCEVVVGVLGGVWWGGIRVNRGEAGTVARLLHGNHFLPFKD